MATACPWQRFLSFTAVVCLLLKCPSSYAEQQAGRAFRGSRAAVLPAALHPGRHSLSERTSGPKGALHTRARSRRGGLLLDAYSRSGEGGGEGESTSQRPQPASGLLGSLAKRAESYDVEQDDTARAQLMPPGGALFLGLRHHYNAKAQQSRGGSGKSTELHEALFAHDLQRHGSRLRIPRGARRRLAAASAAATWRRTSGNSTGFLLRGATYPNGLYYTQIGLGTPAQTFQVDIDSGSNLLWVNCQPCQQCTASQQQQLNPPFNTTASSTARAVQCGDASCLHPDPSVATDACPAGATPGAPGSSACSYEAQYGDSSETVGTLVTDVLRDPYAPPGSPFALRVILGCGVFQTGNFYNGASYTVYEGVDGLLGLGRGNFSLLSALAASAPHLKVSSRYALCLGGAAGRGSLAFGSFPTPRAMVYTPLKTDPTFFRVSLVRVSVAGQEVAAPPSAYGSLPAGNAMFDSGTTYTIAPTRIQAGIMNAIKRAVGVVPTIDNPQDDPYNVGLLCFQATPSLPADAIIERFPTINLQFEGRGVFMNIVGATYGFQVAAGAGVGSMACARVVPSAPEVGLNFIIGDIWMRNFFVDFDASRERLGWAPATCP